MKYTVYRQSPNKQVFKVAECEYLTDAVQIYNNWHSAYIIHEGSIVQEKNMEY